VKNASVRIPRPEESLPEKKAVALLLIDVINDFAFPEAKNLLRYAFPAARKIAALKSRVAAQGIPVIYVNDNFGRWRSDFEAQVEHCLEANASGRSITELLRPGPEDYFVLKPKHSGFYSTTLDVLLHHLGVTKIILAGFAADICVLYTANDAYMRDLDIVVPSDCVASETLQAKKHALNQMKRFLKAQVLPSARVRFSGSYRQSNTDKGHPHVSHPHENSAQSTDIVVVNR
jgi:nicotinamidase-related amidase